MGLPRRVTNESTHVNGVPAGPEWSNRELLPITCYTVLWRGGGGGGIKRPKPLVTFKLLEVPRQACLV